MSKDIDYGRWRKLISRIQLIVVIVIFIVEIVANIMLYLSRTQGYGPDTIVVKLLRYLVLTSATNLGIYLVAQYIVKKNPNDFTLQKYTLILSSVMIFGNVSFSHYQFTVTFASFAIAIMLTVLYEDKKLCLAASAVFLAVSCTARALDPLYNQDIGPEAAISFAIVLVFHIITKLCIGHLQETRNLLNEALIHEEEQNTRRFWKRRIRSWICCPRK